MRESLSEKLLGTMKVKANLFSWGEILLPGASSTDLDGFLKGLSMSVSVRTRKMVNYAW
jgi:hypothetical protein